MPNDFISIENLIKDFPRACKRLVSVSCSPTWEPLIRHMCAQIEAELNGFVPEDNSCYYCGYDPITCTNNGHSYAPEIPSVEEIKSKFGTLRVYLSSTTDKINEIVNLAEVIAFETCEDCGKIGGKGYDVRGWVTVLCEECSRIVISHEYRDTQSQY